MPLNLGVLIIGSLLWDIQRQAWRETRLRMASAQAAMAPICYGRLSRSRDNTYTMVFSRLCHAGRAKVVPCLHGVATPADLVAEAEALWRAEYSRAKPGQIATDWGCVALLCNPESKIPTNLLQGWTKLVGNVPNYGNLSQAPDEGRLVSEGGILNIEWPRLVDGGEGVGVDMLLATANEPTLTESPPYYPGAADIANAWKAAAKDHVKYFWNNTANGITTFQDEDIRKLLVTEDH